MPGGIEGVGRGRSGFAFISNVIGDQSLSDFWNDLMFMEDRKSTQKFCLSTQLDHLKVISSERRKMEEVPGASPPRLSFIRLSSPWVLLDGKNTEHSAEHRTEGRRRQSSPD